MKNIIAENVLKETTDFDNDQEEAHNKCGIYDDYEEYLNLS
mgnify:CR=1 FL=1